MAKKKKTRSKLLKKRGGSPSAPVKVWISDLFDRKNLMNCTWVRNE